MKFEFCIGGYPGPFFNLKKKRNFLYCTEMRDDKSERIEHTVSIKENEKWKELVHFLESRKWKEKYEELGIVDGTGWDLIFQTEKTKLDCSGSNAYPPGFRKFLNILNEVTSGIGVRVY